MRQPSVGARLAIWASDGAPVEAGGAGASVDDGADEVVEDAAAPDEVDEAGESEDDGAGASLAAPPPLDGRSWPAFIAFCCAPKFVETNGHPFPVPLLRDELAKCPEPP